MQNPSAASTPASAHRIALQRQPTRALPLARLPTDAVLGPITASHPLQLSYVVAELLKGPRHAGGFYTVKRKENENPISDSRLLETPEGGRWGIHV